MPNFTGHIAGMPCWIDTNVETSEQREMLIKFYSALFGWTFDVGPVETGSYSTASHNGQAVLAIGEQSGGLGHWVTYFSTSDIDQSVERVKENGGQVSTGPMQVKEFGFFALARDSTGAIHGLWQPINFQGFGVMYEPNTPGWFDHVSENTQSASTYYENVLGNGVEHHNEGEMQILRRGEQWFASLSQEENSIKSPQWMPVFVVDSLERFRGEVRKLGGKIIVEEMSVPGSTISIFQEPVMKSYMTVMAEGAS